jgi:membrane associated rhomboid family serine protease
MRALRKNTQTMGHILSLVQRFGSNSQSFLSAYKGFHYFQSRRFEGAIAYVITDYAWISAGDPLCESANSGALMKEFREAARAHGRVAMLMPVGRETAEKAQKLGFGAVKIGSDPVFDFKEYKPQLEIVPAAKKLSVKGARVREISPQTATPQKVYELDRIVKKWLEKQTSTRGFLSKVEPWSLSEHKKYFYAEYNDNVIAFLSAVPIPSRGGWYLVDIFQADAAPQGTNELLVLESMRQLKSQGAEMVSLGFSPLSDLNPSEVTGYEKLTKALRFVLHRVHVFHNFQPLHHFKMKFQPNLIEPAYLVFAPNKIGLPGLMAILTTIGGKPPLRAFFSLLINKARKFDYAKALTSQLRPGLIANRKKESLWQVFSHLRVTTALLLSHLCVSIFFAQRPEAFLQRFAFSIEAFTHLKWEPALISPFLHDGIVHLVSNIIALALCLGSLEYLAGPKLVLLTYFAGAFLSNPLTALLLTLLKPLTPNLWETSYLNQSLGSALGSCGSLGAVLALLKNRKTFFLLLSAIFLGSAFLWNILNSSYVFALLIGFSLSRMAFSRKRAR